MKNLIYLLLIAGIFLSCSKDVKELQEAPFSNPLSLIQSALALSGDTLSKGDMEVSIISNSVKTKYGEFKGSFQTTGSIVEGSVDGNLTVGNYNVPLDGAIFYGSADADELLKNQKDNLFGQDVNVTLSGTSLFGDYNVNYYVPQFIDAQLNNYEILDRSQDLVVQWPLDENNIQNPVYVIVQYNPNSNFNEKYPALPDQMITKVFEFQEADGGGSIPSAELSDLPLNSKVEVHVGRGNVQRHTINEQTLQVLAVNVTTVPDLLVQ